MHTIEYKQTKLRSFDHNLLLAVKCGDRGKYLEAQHHIDAARQDLEYLMAEQPEAASGASEEL